MSQFTVLNVSNPKYMNEEGTIIDCIVQFSGFNEPLPFTARPDDSTLYGKNLYQALIDGNYGTIAAYDPPDPNV